MRSPYLALRTVTLIAAMVLWIGPTLAQPAGDAGDAAAEPDAASLFDRGLQDMLDGKYETGCPALRRSYQLEPLPGALFTLAECEAKWGRLATAMKLYREYLDVFRDMTPEDQGQQRGRDQIARDQIDALRGEAPKVQIVVPPNAPEGTQIELDGEPLDATTLAGPVPVDPGSHQVSITVPGAAAPRQYDFEVVENQRTAVRLELPEGARVEEEEPSEPIEFGLREGSYIVGGVGAALLIVGIVAGGVTMGKKSTIEDNCVDVQCTPEGLDAADSASTSGAVSTVGFIAGPALLGAAVVMFVFGGDDDDGASDAEPAGETVALEPLLAAPDRGLGAALLGVRGTF